MTVTAIFIDGPKEGEIEQIPFNQAPRTFEVAENYWNYDPENPRNETRKILYERIAWHTWEEQDQQVVVYARDSTKPWHRHFVDLAAKWVEGNEETTSA